MSSRAHAASGTATYRTVRELGSRSPRAHAAVRGPNELVVVYRYARAAVADAPGKPAAGPVVATDGSVSLPAAAIEPLLRDAKCLARNWHPNIARVRHVELQGDDLLIATELLDGATLEDLIAFAARGRGMRAPADLAREPLLPLPVIVRILVDVLAGLHGLHGLRDAGNAPLGVIHGALCPANIIVGKDGVARIVNVLRTRPVHVSTAPEPVGYAAPEALDAGGTSDPRADIHSIGVVFWEVLTGRRLYDEIDPARVLARQRGDEIEPPALPAGSPFAGLADVVMQALSFDPALRFRTAAEMGAAVRKVAGARIATGSIVAAQVAELAGDPIRARRTALDPTASGSRRRATEEAVEAAVQAKARATAQAASAARASAGASGGASGAWPSGERPTTVPPAVLDAREEAPPSSGPTSEPEEMGLRELMSSAPPLHASTLVGHVAPPRPALAAPAVPAIPVPAIPRAATVPLGLPVIAVPTPQMAMSVPEFVTTPLPSPARVPVMTPVPSIARTAPPKAPPLARKPPPPAAPPPSSHAMFGPPAPSSDRMLAPSAPSAPASERGLPIGAPPSPDSTFAAVVEEGGHAGLASPSATAARGRRRKAAVVVLGCVLLALLVIVGAALTSSDEPSPTAASRSPRTPPTASSVLPSTAVTVPPTAPLATAEPVPAPAPSAPPPAPDVAAPASQSATAAGAAARTPPAEAPPARPAAPATVRPGSANPTPAPQATPRAKKPTYEPLGI